MLHVTCTITMRKRGKGGKGGKWEKRAMKALWTPNKTTAGGAGKSENLTEVDGN